MNTITIKNPSQNVINQAALDLHKALDQEANRTFEKALRFLGKSGNKTFRSKPLVITIENDSK